MLTLSARNGRRVDMTASETTFRRGPYPTTKTARQAIRDRNRQDLIDAAEREARMFGRSINCGNSPGAFAARHAGESGGCRNDGSTCICECHDQ